MVNKKVYFLEFELLLNVPATIILQTHQLSTHVFYVYITLVHTNKRTAYPYYFNIFSLNSNFRKYNFIHSHQDNWLERNPI